jgi:hypothetical protein
VQEGQQGISEMSKSKRVQRDWPSVMQEYRESGLSVQQFCRDRGISPGLFYKWRKRLSNAPAGESNAGFVELLRGAAGSCSSGVRLQLGDEVTVCLERGFDPATLKDVLAAVGVQSHVAR